MSVDFGDVPAGDTLYIPFGTYGKTNGESITMSGFAVTDIEVYKNGSMTQRASDNGYTLLDTDGIDVDSITGIHGFSINLSDNSDASFYAVGSRYFVIVSSVTVDGQTINFVAATFRIVAAEAIAGKPKVDVDGFGGTAGTFSGGIPDVNTVKLGGTTQTGRDIGASVLLSNGTGTGQIKLSGGYVSPNWGDIGNPTTVVNLSGTTIKTATDVEIDTADIQTRLPAALVSGRMDSYIGATAASLSFNLTGNITGNLSGSVGSVTGSVGSIAAGGISTSSFVAGAVNNTVMSIDGSELTAIPWNPAWDTEVQSEVQDAIEVNNLDHLLKVAVDTNFATTVHNNSVFGYLAAISATADFDRTLHSLEASYDQRVTVSTDIANVPTEVWEYTMEASLAAKQILELMAARLLGRVENAELGTHDVYGLDDFTIRVEGTTDTWGNRTSIVLTPGVV